MKVPHCCHSVRRTSVPLPLYTWTSSNPVTGYFSSSKQLPRPNQEAADIKLRKQEEVTNKRYWKTSLWWPLLKYKLGEYCKKQIQKMQNYTVLGWFFDACVPNCLFCLCCLLSSLPLRLDPRGKEEKEAGWSLFWEQRSHLCIPAPHWFVWSTDQQRDGDLLCF